MKRAEGLLHLLNQHFPSVLLAGKSVVQSRIQFGSSPHTFSTSIEAAVKFTTLKGRFTWGCLAPNNGFSIDWHTRADAAQQQQEEAEAEAKAEAERQEEDTDNEDDEDDEEAEALVDELEAILTLHELLTCCNMSRLLSSLPAILLGELRLRKVIMRIENPHSATPDLYVYAHTGDEQNDRLLLIRDHVYPDNQTDEVARNAVVLRIFSSQIITPRRFPGLARTGQGKAAHSFVYAEADSQLHNNWSFRFCMAHCHYAGRVPRGCLFPDDAAIVHGALTIKQQSKLVWTNINEALTVPPSLALQHSHVTAGPSTLRPTRSTTPFPIPTLMLTDSRCSLALFQYLLTWLDNNSLLFGLRYVTKHMRASSVLMDGALWKTRVAAEFGARVTRWDDATLRHWRDEWLQRKTATLKYRQDAHTAMSTDEQQTLRARPLWFAAAIQLQTRLNKFAAEIMRMPTPQTDDTTITDDQQDEDDNIVALASAELQRPHYGIPSSLQFVLLTSPPFHHGNAYLMRSFQLWTCRQQQAIRHYGPRALAHPDLRWFAYHDNEEHTHYLALWLGRVFVGGRTLSKLGRRC